MKLFQSVWERIFPPIAPLPAGMYHYQAPPDSEFPYRLHLRLQPDGKAVLIVNASTVVHLNRTAAEYAYHIVQNTPEETAVNAISRRYNVRKEIVIRDYHDLKDRLQTLVDTPDLDPVTFLNFDREEPYNVAGSVPYRIDCALTYRLPDESRQNVAPMERVSRELLDAEWKQILEKAWNAGIPHVIFTGGEPTLRPDLSELIAHAEKMGMVTGLITDGVRLAEPEYLHHLLQSGLDHLMILLDPDEEICWEALRDSLAEDISVTCHITLNEHILPKFDTLLDRLVSMGLENLSLSAESIALKDVLQEKRQVVAERQLRLIWDLPVPYSHFQPVALELAEDLPEVATLPNGPGKAWIYIEPDGDVLPGQGYYQQTLGNLASMTWDQVWASLAAIK